MAVELPSHVVLLADSTAYGWLREEGTPVVSGAGLVVRQLPASGTPCTAAIVCGGSLVKPGTRSKAEGRQGKTILEEIMPWLETEALGLGPDAAVVTRAVPARRSVPQREYGALETARTAFGTKETKRAILDICPECYGKGDKLHFAAASAVAGLERVVEAAVADIQEEIEEASRTAMRSLAAEEASAVEELSATRRSLVDVGFRDRPWVAVVICCGWNCSGERVLAEAGRRSDGARRTERKRRQTDW